MPDRAERSSDSDLGYLARALGTALEGQTKVYDKLGEQAGDAGMKTVGVPPKLTASSADALRKELKLFYNYVNDARVKDRAKYFKIARANASGTFLAELDLYIANEIGKTELLQGGGGVAFRGLDAQAG